MSYEKHLCSVKHLLTELDPNAASDDTTDEVVKDDTNDKSNKDDQDGSDDDDFDFDCGNFITLDEVGDDEEDDTSEPIEGNNKTKIL